MSTHPSASAPTIPMLRPGALREPLLKALGKATDYTANVFVQHTTVLEEVIREAGFDPANLPTGWSRSRRSNGGTGVGLDRNISLAFRYAYRDKKPALTVKGSKAGLWGLTEHGVQLVKGILPRPLPRPKIFHEPLIKVLGILSNHTAHDKVIHDKVIHDVMVEIGVDPANLPLGWRERGSNRQVKALDRVRWAVKSMRVAKVPLIEQLGRGKWALTEAGEIVARKLNGVAPLPPKSGPHQSGPEKPLSASKPQTKATDPNTTGKWLGKHLTPPKGQQVSDLYRMMRAALCKRLPVSANTHQVEDHIQNFMVRMIRRDAFAKILEDGGKVLYSKVVAYCVNSGRTDARDMGTEPVCREMFGARTEKERRERRETVPQFGEEQAVVWDTDGNFVPQDEIDFIDDSSIDFDRVWDQIVNVIHDHKPQAYKRYAGILAMRAQGYSTKEISQKEGVSRNRAASMLAEARRCVRDSYARGHLDGFVSMPLGG